MLERRIGAICRAVAVKVAENTTAKKHKEKAMDSIKVCKQLIDKDSIGTLLLSCY